jgi:hypothetical protein
MDTLGRTHDDIVELCTSMAALGNANSEVPMRPYVALGLLEH